MGEFSNFPIKLDKKNFPDHVKTTYGSQDKSSTALLAIFSCERTLVIYQSFRSGAKSLPEVLSGIYAALCKGRRTLCQPPNWCSLRAARVRCWAYIT